MKLTITFDRTLKALREVSTLSSNHSLTTLHGAMALENGRDIIALSGDLLLLVRELLNGLKKMIVGHCPTFLLMDGSDAWQISKLGSWIVVRSDERVDIADNHIQRSHQIGKIRGQRLKVARAVLKGCGELLMQLFAINNRLEMIAGVAGIRRAHQELAETVEAARSETIGKKLGRLPTELLSDRWKASTAFLLVIVGLQAAILSATLRYGTYLPYHGVSEKSIRSTGTKTNVPAAKVVARNATQKPIPTQPASIGLLPGFYAGAGKQQTTHLAPPFVPGPLPYPLPRLGMPSGSLPSDKSVEPSKLPALPRLEGTIETSISSAALFADGNTVDVYGVGSQLTSGWRVRKVQDGKVTLEFVNGKKKTSLAVSIPAFVRSTRTASG